MERANEFFSHPESRKNSEELTKLFMLFRSLQDVELGYVRGHQLADDLKLGDLPASCRVVQIIVEHFKRLVDDD